MNGFLIGLSLIIRLYLQAAAWLAEKFIAFKPSFPYWDLPWIRSVPQGLSFWSNFDGVHYINIALSGYEYGLTQAFFPVYPLLIRFFSAMGGQPLINGLIISHLAFAGFVYLFIKLGRLDYKPKTVRWAAFFLLLFPSSFFFFGVYTESLFLFLAAASLYFSRKKSWWLAALVAGLASGTRLVGIFLLPAILLEYWQTKSKQLSIKIFSLSLLSWSGFLAYGFYLSQKFNNFFMFVTSQPGFGGGRQVDKLVLPYQVLARYIKMLVTVDKGNDIYLVLWWELIVTLLIVAVLIWAYIKKMRRSYLIFAVPALLLPTLTGTLASMPRYCLVFFPAFYLLGKINKISYKLVIAAVFFLLLTWSFIRFSRGYWIA